MKMNAGEGTDKDGKVYDGLSNAIRLIMRELGLKGSPVAANPADSLRAAGFRGAVFDLLEIAQPAVADWHQQLPGRADVGVARASYRNSSLRKKPSRPTILVEAWGHEECSRPARRPRCPRF